MLGVDALSSTFCSSVATVHGNRRYQPMQAVSNALLLRRWTPIATRPRNVVADATLLWSPMPDTPLDIADAWRLAETGMLLMAQRHFPDRVELVVRAAKPPANAPISG